MSIRGALLAGRARAERLMTDTITVSRMTRTWDEVAGEYTETMTTVYSGPGKFQFFDAAYEQTPEAGAHVYTEARAFLHLPVDATGIAKDDVAVATASPLTPALVGVEHRIASIPLKSHGTALRLPVERQVA